MGVIEQVGLAADDPVGCPLIGYDNLVTASNITASTEAEGFPATNLANPATHLKWAGGQNLAMLLHMEGSDGGTVFTDSAVPSRVWTAHGNANTDTSQFKFGSTSLDLSSNSPPGYIDTPDSDAFTLGSGDFTFDCWFRVNAATGVDTRLFGQSDTVATPINTSIFGDRTGDKMRAIAAIGTSFAVVITGTTSFTNLVNTGWHHYAFVRSGNNFRMFIDGVQEGSTIVSASAVNDSNFNWSIGILGELTTTPWNGWIDEVSLVHYAKWTANFTPPASANTTSTQESITAAVNTTIPISYVGVAKHNFATIGASVSLELNDGGGFVEIIAASTPTNDDPIIFRFTPHSANSPAVVSVRVKIVYDGAADPPEAAVIYVGELLVLERSIDIGSGHVPITYGRRPNIINGMSDTGNFLGRIMLGEYRQSKAEFKWFTSEFYRSDIDAFLAAAQEIPFFWAWSPEEYPLEVGYVWLTNDAEPEVDPVTRRIALDLEMRGIA